jgi:anti-anti-sigma factor
VSSFVNFKQDKRKLLNRDLGGIEMDIKIRERNDIVIVDVGGDIRQYEIKGFSLYQHVKEQLQAGKRKILINFDKVDFVDSLGIGDLLSSYCSTNNLGGTIKLLKVSPKIHLILQVTLMDRLFEFFEDEDTAIQSFH